MHNIQRNLHLYLFPFFCPLVFSLQSIVVAELNNPEGVSSRVGGIGISKSGRTKSYKIKDLFRVLSIRILSSFQIGFIRLQGGLYRLHLPILLAFFFTTSFGSLVVISQKHVSVKIQTTVQKFTYDHNRFNTSKHFEERLPLQRIRDEFISIFILILKKMIIPKYSFNLKLKSTFT